ncbi:hypothetical protein EC968_000258 [Mortierella alpina]|nr:hypothetical protein EC968_000258 [Mortierella alpina]
MAKVAGTILWAPMAKLNALQSRHCSQHPLTLRDAVCLARQVCQSSPRGIGVLSLWSEYGTTLRALLPYTMLYFAVYEQLKQLARGYFYEDQDHAGEFRNRNNSALQRGHRPPTEGTPSPLGLGTYMSCVAGAVAISSTICHSASALTKQFKEFFYRRHATTPAPSSSVAGVTQPHSSTDPAAVLSKTAFSVSRVSSATGSHPTMSINNSLFAGQQAQHTSITTHASATTTTTMTASMAMTTANIMPKEATVRTAATPPSTLTSRRPVISNACDKVSTRVFQMRLPRSILRGLGPRILWTAPNVVLTTAGFEVLRNMAQAAA